MLRFWRNRATRASKVANVDIERSTFPMHHWARGTGKFGDLIPVDCIEILPSDTFSITAKIVARTVAPLAPVMDNAYFDIAWFFVPNRLVWTHWQEFMGENNTSAGIPSQEYAIPSTTPTAIFGGGVGFPTWETAGHTNYDYLGLPIASVGTISWKGQYKLSVLPFRGIGMVYNQWYRAQDTQAPLAIDTSDSATANDLELAKTILPVDRFPDYFSRALPYPQKGPSVRIPGFDENVPVVTEASRSVTSYNNQPLQWISGGTLGSAGQTFSVKGQITGSTSNLANTFSAPNDSSPVTYARTLAPANLWAQNESLEQATINNLRFAFQVQKWYERNNNGSRYIEILANHFGAHSPDSRLQRTEFLGNTRIQMAMQQVVQTSESSENSALGSVGAISKTNGICNKMVHSFVEHGYLFCFLCARVERSYQDGVRRTFTRRDKFDYYWPEFAHLGNQPIYTYEIYGYDPNGSADNPSIFGYKEAWDEYRFQQSYVTGAFRSNANGSLDFWTYTDSYSRPPILSDSWMREGYQNVERTLSTDTITANGVQFWYDVFFETSATRPMPVRGTPGLVDHF